MRACILSRSSDRWRKGCCVSTVRRLPSYRALKPLVPTLCLGVVAIYGLADKLRNFVVSIFIPQYHYSYPVALCFAQVLVSLLFLNLLHVFGLVPLRRYYRSLGERLLVPAICNGIHAVLAMWAKSNCSCGGLFPLTTPLLPLLTVSFSFVLKLKALPSVRTSVLISILSGLFIVFSVFRGVTAVEPLEYFYAPLALILHSLSLTWLAKVSDIECRHSHSSRASIFDIYYTQLVNQCWVLGLVGLLHPDQPWQVLSRGSWHSLLFLGYLLAILLLGTVLTFTVGASALRISPLSAALLYSARDLVEPFILML